MRPDRSKRFPVAAAALLGLVAWCAACDDAKEPAKPSTPSANVPAPTAQATQNVDPKDQLARELAARQFASEDSDVKAKTLETLKPLIERTNPNEDDLVSAGIVELDDHKDQALARLNQVLVRNPNSARAHFVLGSWMLQQGDFAAAEDHLRKGHAAAPDDVPTRLLLAEAIEVEKPVEAEQLYRGVIALGVDQLGSWYVLALYRLSGVLQTKNGDEAALAAIDKERLGLLREKEELENRGIKPPDYASKYRGILGRIAPPRATPGDGPKLAALPTFTGPFFMLPESAGARIEAVDADGNCRMDLLSYGPNAGLQLAFAHDGLWRAETLASGRIAAAKAFDFGNDDDLDVAYLADGALRLIEAVRDPATQTVTWKAREGEILKLDGLLDGAQIDVVDYDHEGDLDLLMVGAFGVRLLRSDGAEKPGGKFTDVTADAGLPTNRAFAWCVIEDYDTDQDVDLLLGGPSGSFLASNLRGGKFEDQSTRLAGFASAHRPVVADFDHDGRPDLWDAAGGSELWLGRASANFARTKLAPPVANTSWVDQAVVDLDLDGFFDVLGLDESGITAVRALGWPAGDATAKIAVAGAEVATSFACADFDGDLKPDLAVACGRGVAFLNGTTNFGNAVRLAALGKKDNRRGIGAVVEVRAGGNYQRLFWRGEAELVGVGAATALDWHRTLWPDGSFQWMRSVALGDRVCSLDARKDFEQSEALRGSCPFLYTWNGERNVFVSDVLGITPLGLPMAPGEFVPPDHDEYVLVRGEQLAAKDGVFELHFTEELREVTYLDRIRLDVIDHPIGTEIFPNELFCFPPFPTPHVHTMREPLAPTRVVGSDGKDWTAALAKNDEVFAVPFMPAPAQFRGLANPHFLELEFDRERVAQAQKLRLVLNGWFFWTDASVNLASAYDPEQEFVPPIVQVPDGQGGWRDAGPPIGFPAGKTKTMVIDAESLILRDDPRIRIFGTLRLYWDSIRLAVDDDDAPIEVTRIEPQSAQLWRRGFSAPLVDDRPNEPERFDWNHLAEYPSWNPHPGLYTKYGECLPLVTDVDDRFVILASGDALTARFDAKALPPPKPGTTRDYFLFLDGWAKDRDPNTVEALYVEPLPFHAMSAYPYGANETFPDDEVHRRWRREWNTRSAEPWIRSFADGDPQLGRGNGPSKASIAPRN
ncbi:MAG: FG-GAP-like repeat-containing protein [Planctomycetes bacterium]|nr:FG-GAP-like repeat-containing protein [Planctomycetota bacterium]